MAVSNRIKSALTTTVLATAATGFMAGCGVGEDEDEQVAYCTNEDGEIVDDDFCDDGYNGGGLFFLYVGGFRSGLPVGSRLPVGRHPDRPAGHAGAAAGRAARHRRGQRRDTGRRRHRQRPRRPVGDRRGEATRRRLTGQRRRERDRPAGVGGRDRGPGPGLQPHRPARR